MKSTQAKKRKAGESVKAMKPMKAMKTAVEKTTATKVPAAKPPKLKTPTAKAVADAFAKQFRGERPAWQPAPAPVAPPVDAPSKEKEDWCYIDTKDVPSVWVHIAHDRKPKFTVYKQLADRASGLAGYPPSR